MSGRLLRSAKLLLLASLLLVGVSHQTGWINSKASRLGPGL